MKRHVLIFIIITLFSTNTVAKSKPILIITPMPIEAAYYHTHLSNLKLATSTLIKCYRGNYHQQEIILCNSGIGKVNMAFTSSYAITHFKPKLTLITGSSGAINKKLYTGDVIIGSRVFDADYGKLTKHGIDFPEEIKNPNRNQANPLFFHPQAKLINKVHQLLGQGKLKIDKAQVKLGTISASDMLPNPAWQRQLLRDNHDDVVAMEDSALMQACWLMHTKCLAIRGVSNLSGQRQQAAATVLSARNSAITALRLISALY